MEGAVSASDPAVMSQVPLPVASRRIAILGFGRTVKDCPWKDDTWELWAMNGFWRAAEPDFGITAPPERYSLWFDMHTVEYTRAYGKAAGIGDQQERWLEKEHPFPVLMLDEDAAFPSVRAYPIRDIIATTGKDYFTSTVAYALAFVYALAKEQPGSISEVGLWGIDLIHDTEYAEQRPCAEYWVGRLEGLGITVSTHAESALLKTRHRYGYETGNALARDLRKALREQIEALNQSITKHQEQMRSLENQAHTDNGAQQMLSQVLAQIDRWERGGRNV